ncbi:hypothetical protein GJV85_01060 [Sulfurimonas aquatica]|uniref:Uncharacterized protein n=1 Tax=Sulfurimonas aquatica TaxID=2672570 RepID=A0A975GBZ9_9BACT|nr:hypothetical protein [Sulfurimonas aquatica]QSZ40763.1 hypothetical protein GJV85_01060 [Sulfurimonas aquatica]
MQVKQYTFQSPSSSQVQVGRPDMSTKSETSSSGDLKNTNQTLAKAESFAQTQVSEVKPTVSSNQLLDVYA